MQNQVPDPKPPWFEYPDTAPFWGGWRQGVGGGWLLNVWLPFWQHLTPEEKDAYLRQYPPPDDDWLLYLTHYWR